MASRVGVSVGMALGSNVMVAAPIDATGDKVAEGIVFVGEETASEAQALRNGTERR